MSHALTIETPTMADLRNGASDDVVVAQCSCGRYEFTTSTEEAGYWHWLHRTTPSATAFYLLSNLVDQPMPEGWTEPAKVNNSAAQESHACVDCSGQGTTEMYGTADGRFYATGSRRRCAVCGGAGTLNAKLAREASVARIAASLLAGSAS